MAAFCFLSANQIHPAISSVTRTFESVGKELVNFFVSFGVIFVLLAFIAFIRCLGPSSNMDIRLYV